MPRKPKLSNANVAKQLRIAAARIKYAAQQLEYLADDIESAGQSRRTITIGAENRVESKHASGALALHVWEFALRMLSVVSDYNHGTRLLPASPPTLSNAQITRKARRLWLSENNT